MQHCSNHAKRRLHLSGKKEDEDFVLDFPPSSLFNFCSFMCDFVNCCLQKFSLFLLALMNFWEPNYTSQLRYLPLEESTEQPSRVEGVMMSCKILVVLRPQLRGCQRYYIRFVTFLRPMHLRHEKSDELRIPPMWLTICYWPYMAVRLQNKSSDGRPNAQFLFMFFFVF